MAENDDMPVSDVTENHHDDISTAPKAGLLIAVGELLESVYTEAVCAYIVSALKAWDIDTSGCDINEKLSNISNASPIGEDKTEGERHVLTSDEALELEVWINPKKVEFEEALSKFLLKDYSYHFFVYGGLYFAGSGHLILQDEAYSSEKFLQKVKHTVATAENWDKESKNVVFFLPAEGNWNALNLPLAEHLCSNLSLNPSELLLEFNGVLQFGGYLACLLKPKPLKDLLKKSEVVGNIRFARPTLYIFPAGQGNSVLFGITGFNLLIDGGYERKSCFWDFVRHLDRVDALLISHVSENNLFGLRSFLERKAISKEVLYPEIGPILCNAPGHVTTENGIPHISRAINVAAEGKKLQEAITRIKNKTYPCIGKTEKTGVNPENLYHKMGQGKLDMYVLNPPNDNNLKDFFDQWTKEKSSTVGGIPSANSMSVVTLLVWKPASQSKNITRLLFPGSLPQNELLTALDKVKNLPFLQHRECTEKSVGEKAGSTSHAPRSQLTAQQPSTKTARTTTNQPRSHLTTTNQQVSTKSAAKPSPSSSETEISTFKKSAPKPSSALDKTLTKQPQNRVRSATDTKGGTKSSPAASSSKTDSEKSATAKELPKKAATATTRTKSAAADSKASADLGKSQKAGAEKPSSGPRARGSPRPATTGAKSSGDKGKTEAKSADAVKADLTSKTLPSKRPPAEGKTPASPRTPTSAGRGKTLKEKTDSPLAGSTTPGRTTTPGGAKAATPKAADSGKKKTPRAATSASSSRADSADKKKDDKVSTPSKSAAKPAESGPIPMSKLPSPPDASESNPESLGTDLDLVQANAQSNIDNSSSEGTNFDEAGKVASVDQHQEGKGDPGTCVDAVQISDVVVEVSTNNAGTDVDAAPQTEKQSKEVQQTDEPEETNDDKLVKQEADVVEEPNTEDQSVLSETFGDTDKVSEVAEDSRQDSVDSLEKSNTSESLNQDGQTSGLPPDWDEPMPLPSPKAYSDEPAIITKGIPHVNCFKKPQPATRAKQAVRSSKGPRTAPAPSQFKSGGSGKSLGAGGAGNSSSSVGGQKPSSGRLGDKSNRKDLSSVHSAAGGKLGAKANTKVSPLYVDLAYIPHQGGIVTVDAEFFKRVRARYYVLSLQSDDVGVFDSFLSAKASWEEDSGDAPVSVTLVPTYESAALRVWLTRNYEKLQSLGIDIAPSAQRCIIHLQDHDASCSAYRLEF